MAWAHYLECSATGCWPDDGIVRRNAGIIRGVEQQLAAIDRWTSELRHKTTVDLVLAVLQARLG